MQVPQSKRNASSPRTLESLKSDLQKFRNNGGNIKDAKLYNNVIDETMFDVPINQVSLYLYKSVSDTVH